MITIINIGRSKKLKLIVEGKWVKWKHWYVGRSRQLLHIMFSKRDGVRKEMG
jgi:hypothetical protein